MDEVSYADFAKLDIRIAKIVAAEEIEGADKLLKLTLEVGDLGERTIAAGIKAWYKPEDLIGKYVPYLSNLAPRIIRGVESQGMLLAASSSREATKEHEGAEDEAILLHPDKDLPAGAKVR